MQDLFEFELPKPLSQEAEKILRERLLMRRHQKVSFYEGIAVPWPNVQVLLISQDEHTYRLVARSYQPMSEQMLCSFRSQVAQIAQSAGSIDPRIQSAIQRQAPRQEGIVRPPGRAANKPGLLGRLSRSRSHG